MFRCLFKVQKTRQQSNYDSDVPTTTATLPDSTGGKELSFITRNAEVSKTLGRISDNFPDFINKTEEKSQQQKKEALT